MLACFTRGSGLERRGSKRQRTCRPQKEWGYDSLIYPTPEEEEQVSNQFSVLKERLGTRQRERVEEVMFGAGANGIAFVEGPQCSLAVDRNVAVFFQGELSYELPDELESPAHDILRRYANEELSTTGKDMNLGNLSGSFAILLFDKFTGRILVARDQSGREPLFWGTSNFGQMLLVSSNRLSLEAKCTDVDEFPAGTLFKSRGGELTGELTMLLSDNEDDNDDWDWDDVDFIVQDDQADVVCSVETADDKVRQSGKDTTLAVNKPWHAETCAGVVKRDLVHCKQSFENLNQIDSDPLLEGSLHGSENNLVEVIHKVGSQAKIHAVA